KHKYTADVIMFGENSAWEPPSPRPHNQLWIIRLLESPENTHSLKAYDNQVNVTISYRQDSDLPIAYGRYEAFPTPQESITTVDIFGACGKRSPNKVEAHRMIREHYKFYLAFENSNCHQYITEKFWINALRNDAIPIVMGAPKADYIKVAPPNSFIHVDDYTPEQLSRYLLYLDRNRTAYNEYFAWKTGVVWLAYAEMVWITSQLSYWAAQAVTNGFPQAVIMIGFLFTFSQIEDDEETLTFFRTKVAIKAIICAWYTILKIYVFVTVHRSISIGSSVTEQMDYYFNGRNNFSSMTSGKKAIRIAS
ncbi:fucosyl transferase, partial [Teladorsagia circumcincta]